jgi:hypothetical protein
MMILQGIPSYFGSYDADQAMSDDLILGAGCYQRGRCADMDADYDAWERDFEPDEWSDESEEFESEDDEEMRGASC